NQMSSVCSRRFVQTEISRCPAHLAMLYYCHVLHTLCYAKLLSCFAQYDILYYCHVLHTYHFNSPLGRELTLIKIHFSGWQRNEHLVGAARGGGRQHTS